MRQQQQPAVEGDGLDLLAPELVGDADHREAEILLAEAQLAEKIFPQFLKRCLVQDARAIDGSGKRTSLRADAVAHLPRFGDDFEVGGIRFLIFFVGLCGLRFGNEQHGVSSVLLDRGGSVLRILASR